MPPIWPESYPNVVEQANLYSAAGQYRDAEAEYLKAAAIAPIEAWETDMLTAAFECAEHGDAWYWRLEQA